MVWSLNGRREEENRVISTREAYGGWVSLLSYTVDVTTSVRCDDSSSSSSSSATSSRWLVALLSLLLPRSTFQSKAIDEVANSRRRTILWITGENSLNYTWAERRCPWMSPTKLFPWIRSSLFSLSSNAARCSCCYDNVLFLFPSRRLVFLIFSFFLLKKRNSKFYDDMRVKLDIALCRNNFLFNTFI